LLISLTWLYFTAKEKLGLNGEAVKVVLEQDGTEVDEEDYFSTLERNTSLMLLAPNEKWGPPGRVQRYRTFSRTFTVVG
jgi:DNA fragmentation factor alpha subunit